MKDWENQQPPQADRQEHALLGACLLTPAAIADAVDTGLQTHHFRITHLAALWEAIQQAWARGEPVDIITIKPAAANAHKAYIGAAGDELLIDILDANEVAGHASYYASVIIEAATKRAAYDIALKAAQNPDKAPQILAEAEQLQTYSTPTLHLSLIHI